MHTINLMDVESILVYPPDSRKGTHWRKMKIKTDTTEIEIILFPKNEETKRLSFEAGEPT